MRGQPGERLIFSRILGHFEIPRSYKWQEASECWICERHRYTVMIMSKSIAQQYYLKPSQTEEKFLLLKIRYAEDKRLDT